MSTVRILVTGSRKWTDRDRVRREIVKLWKELPREVARVVLVHGDCATGVDSMLQEFIDEAHWTGASIACEPHPANWYPNGPGTKLDRSASRFGTEIAKGRARSIASPKQ